MIYFYQLAFLLLLAAFLPAACFLILVSRDFRSGIHERLVIYPSVIKKRLKNKDFAFWVHAASVGEIKLLGKIPGFPFKKSVITATTVSGRDLARKMFPESFVFLMPIDAIFLLKRFKRLIRPRRLIILETELWPGFIHLNRDCRPVLLNGRLSRDKFRYYYLLRRQFAGILKRLENIYPKDRENFLRFKKVGAPENILRPPLNLKFISEKPLLDPADRRYGGRSGELIVSGSTHRGEEEILAGIYKRLQKSFRELSMVISPRHLERIPEVISVLENAGIEFKLWSNIKGPLPERTVIILDTMGELSKIYSLADIAFIGGSLVPVGGHNIIEAAVWGVPAVSGKYTDNFKLVYEIFKKTGAVKISGNDGNLCEIFYNLLKDKGYADSIGRRSRETVMREKKKAEGRLKEIASELF